MSRNDPASVMSRYKALLAFRQTSLPLLHGSFAFVNTTCDRGEDSSVLAFLRTYVHATWTETLLVVVNLDNATESCALELHGEPLALGPLMLHFCTYLDCANPAVLSLGTLALLPGQAMVLGNVPEETVPPKRHEGWHILEIGVVGVIVVAIGYYVCKWRRVTKSMKREYYEPASYLSHEESASASSVNRV